MGRTDQLGFELAVSFCCKGHRSEIRHANKFENTLLLSKSDFAAADNHYKTLLKTCRQMNLFNGFRLETVMHINDHRAK